MKKLNQKFLMLRPADGFLPLSLALASVLGQSDAADRLFHYMLFARLFGLASAIGLRQAFARQPSMRMARGSVKAALILQPVGAALVALLEVATNGGRIAPAAAVSIMAGLLLNVEQVFYEYLRAAGEGHSAALSRTLCAALMFGGLMMTSGNSGAGMLSYGLEWMLGAAAISAVVAEAVGLMIGGRLKGRLNGEVIRSAPSAMLQCFLYPLLAAALAAIPGSPTAAARTSAPFFLGLALCELWRTPFRRSAMEARPMTKALAVIAGACVIVLGLCVAHVIQVPDIFAGACLLLVAAACVMGLYGNFAKR